MRLSFLKKGRGSPLPEKRKDLLRALGMRVLPAGVIAVLALLFIVIVTDHINQIARTVEEQRKVSLVLQKRTETITKIRQDLQLVEGSSKKIEAAFITAEDIDQFTTALDTAAKSHDIQQALQFSAPTLASVLGAPLPIASATFLMTQSSTIQKLLPFLRSFEALPYFSNISAISITTSSSGGWINASTMSLQAALFMRAENNP